MTTITNPSRVLGREYVAAPWIVLPTDQQALIIGELSRAHPDTDGVLIIDPSPDIATCSCNGWGDWDHGLGLIHVNDGFPLCLRCASKTITSLHRVGAEVCVEVLREMPW